MNRRIVTLPRRVRFGPLIGGFVLLLPLALSAAQSPQLIIQTAVDQAIAVLEDPAYQGDRHFLTRIEKIKAIVLPHLDTSEFSRRCLGAHWQKLSETQRQEFIGLFTTLMEKSYGSMLDRYPRGVRFSYDQERIDGSFAEVDTRFQMPNKGKQAVVSYRLHQKNSQWLIYDVVVENVSMVRNYRNQFQRILSKSSFEELVQILRQKIEQLDTPPTL